MSWMEVSLRLVGLWYLTQLTLFTVTDLDDDSIHYLFIHVLHSFFCSSSLILLIREINNSVCRGASWRQARNHRSNSPKSYLFIVLEQNDTIIRLFIYLFIHTISKHVLCRLKPVVVTVTGQIQTITNQSRVKRTRCLQPNPFLSALKKGKADTIGPEETEEWRNGLTIRFVAAKINQPSTVH